MTIVKALKQNGIMTCTQWANISFKIAFEEKTNFYTFPSCSIWALIMDRVAFLSVRERVMNGYLEFSRNEVLSYWLDTPQQLVQ